MLTPQLNLLLERFGTGSASHSGRTLRKHLIATAQLLEAWGNTQSVCYAGLFHSIYGTQIYRHIAASLEYRTEIRAVIGDQAELLAYLFCTSDRKELLAVTTQSRAAEDAVVISHRIDRTALLINPSTLAGLLEIAVANEIEQMPFRADLSAPRYRLWRQYGQYCLPFLSSSAQQALLPLIDAGLSSQRSASIPVVSAAAHCPLGEQALVDHKLLGRAESLDS